MSTPKGPSVLDQLEADIKKQYFLNDGMFPPIGFPTGVIECLEDRILALIDLVRKKDEAFRNIADGPAENWIGNSCRQEAKLALALTEELK